jgi:hypothetical protein
MVAGATVLPLLYRLPGVRTLVSIRIVGLAIMVGLAVVGLVGIGTFLYSGSTAIGALLVKGLGFGLAYGAASVIRTLLTDRKRPREG